MRTGPCACGQHALLILARVRDAISPQRAVRAADLPRTLSMDTFGTFAKAIGLHQNPMSPEASDAR